MEPIDVIRQCMQEEGQKAGIAIAVMDQLISEHFDAPRELQKARQGRRFLCRYVDHGLKDHAITDEDFLLTLRDTVLMLGKFPGTSQIRNLVLEKGEDFGLSVEITGEIAAVLPTHPFVRKCYGLDDSLWHEVSKTTGDRILKEETGFDSYKSFEQKTAVYTAMSMPEGFTLLVTLSTGEGKSMVTQMSVARDPGLTVLVVPTTALGKDQCRAARAVLKRIPDQAIYDFCGDQTSKLPEVREKLNKKELRLLITSPEALIKNLGLRQAVGKAAEEGYLSRLVIDEAHIVQDWGAAFRPDFQFLSVLRREWLGKTEKKLRTILLSATLTEHSTEHLRTLFSEDQGMEFNWIPVRCDSLRTEIRYITDNLKYSPRLQEDQEKKVLEYVKLLPKPMLIYTIRPDDANRWQKFLWSRNIRNTATFTGLTDDADRTEIIRKWGGDQLDIVVATSAFGMGIDKPDVRTVMHVVMPESINRFYQEVGRGGRDGRPSLSMLCCCPQAEYHQASNITHRKLMTWEKMIQRWFDMLNAGTPEADTVELNTRIVPAYFTDAEKERSGNRNRDWNLHTILFMARHHWIELLDMKYLADTDDYLIKVRMKDPVLMQDREKMFPLGEAARESEYDSADRELKIFQQMIREQDEHCFAESFSSIYTYAEQDCGGCPQHAREHFQSYGYRLHSYISRYRNQSSKALPFKYWRGNRCLIIHQQSPADTGLQLEVAEKLILAGVSTWIQPDNRSVRGEAVRYPGMVLSQVEAEVLLKHHPSILGQAVLVTLGQDPVENQRLLDFGCELLEKRIAVAFHMKMDLVHRGSGKPLHEAMMCRKMSELELG